LINPIKAIRLHWHMRKVKGGFRDGNAHLVADAFERAGIIENNEHDEFVEYLNRERLSKAFLEYADAIKRETK